MSTMDYSELFPKIQAKFKFTAGENIVSIYEVVLLEGWVKTSRILSLIENCGSYGFFVFNVFRGSTGISDILIDYAFPVNNEFKIDVVSEDTDISVTVTFRKVKLLFEMMTSEKTKSFISELHKISEMTARKENSLDFAWLSKYVNEAAYGRSAEDSSQTNDVNGQMEDLPMGSELMVPRHSIARGTTPIAGRESAVRYQMTLKEKDYTYTQSIRIFVGTWNVNGQPPTVSLSDWLSVDPDPPDVYAIGFQELDLSKEAFLFNDSPREDEWLAAVILSLHPKGKYSKVSLVRLVGMMLIIFVKEQHVAYIRNVATDTVGTGIMGKLGNKGGVAVRFDIHNTSLCFVNAHLAAHVEEYERRNQDYRDICSRISFPKFLPPKTIKDHDQVYWFGDLNYRITELDAPTVKRLIQTNSYDAILVHDQLKQNFKAERVFEKYKEGRIAFKPTYKYDTGSDEWDSSEKNRAPAWCDRVLWKSDKIKQICYRSHPELKISDHKPVSALFDSEWCIRLRMNLVSEEVGHKVKRSF